MIDTHAHVHDAKFDEDREAMLARARAAGVDRIITVGCDLADSERALDCARTYGLTASLGIHPHEAIDAPERIDLAFDRLFDAAVHVAIGEIGLDYYYDHSPREIQRRVLDEQLAYAKQRRLPTIFHQRDAFDDFVAALRESYDPSLGGVVHCFTGDAAQARLLVGEFGLRLGIGGVLTFKSAELLREAVRAVGIDALMLETDCPYLAPVPMRGQRNEPAFVRHTAERLAEVLALPLELVLARTDANAEALFTAR
ncbi:MAG: TatD family hydrolase [Candidatus Eremiobacteraeota bacterium]|nr:TatD family hydrolase [Candidatus Eremiobacteraeota bacterium]NNM93433.1 TatD family hydrolase [Candidatus Eremiobacteraeota bacterium]